MIVHEVRVVSDLLPLDRPEDAPEVVVQVLVVQLSVEGKVLHLPISGQLLDGRVDVRNGVDDLLRPRVQCTLPEVDDRQAADPVQLRLRVRGEYEPLHVLVHVGQHGQERREGVGCRLRLG